MGLCGQRSYLSATAWKYVFYYLSLVKKKWNHDRYNKEAVIRYIYSIYVGSVNCGFPRSILVTIYTYTLYTMSTYYTCTYATPRILWRTWDVEWCGTVYTLLDILHNIMYTDIIGRIAYNVNTILHPDL